MYKIVVLIAALLSLPHVYAQECPPETELDASIAKADEDGEARMKGLLHQLKEKRGMTPEQTVEYLSSVLLREGPRTAQSMRERAGAYIINLAPSGDCRAIRSAKANARNIIIVQWQVVAEEIEKDLAQDPVAP